MTQAVKDWLRMMPSDVEAWLNVLAPKNPLLGSDGAKNTNSIMVQIGRRLLADSILEYSRMEKELFTPKPFSPKATDLLGPIKE